MGVFQIGLVLAGGSTKGSYTAGVMDFILEALTELEIAKREGADKAAIPPWDVKINNISSTSAGSICACLTTASVCLPHEPVAHDMKPGDNPPYTNLLYRGWVIEDNAGLWDSTDLPPADALEEEGSITPVRSIFDSNYMMKFGSSLIEDRNPTDAVPKWFDGCLVQVTTGNTRGVPYSFRIGDSLTPGADKYYMRRHRDYVAFQTGTNSGVQGVKSSGAFELNLRENSQSIGWRRFLRTCISSASLPGVFAAQVLTRPISHYSAPKAAYDGIDPCWPDEILKKKEYSYNAVDGAVFNNEPFGLSRHALEQSGCKMSGCVDARQSNGSVLLIDSDANSEQTVAAVDEVKPLDLIGNMSALLNALWYESSFKTEEASRITDEKNIAEFVISPYRPERKEPEAIIATEAMGSFAGALDLKIRHHDFMLGRANAQKFLRENFVVDVKLAAENPVFKGIVEYAGKKSKVPIIPLVGSAKIDCPTPAWPKYTKQEKERLISTLLNNISKRLDVVLAAVARNMDLLKQGSWYNAINSGRNTFVRLVIGSISRTVKERLDSMIRSELKTKIEGISDTL